MSTSVVCIDTVGSDTATVIIRIQEVTNVRVLPPFSVFPRWPDDVGVVRRGVDANVYAQIRAARQAPDTAAEAARVNGAVRARVGRAQLPAAPSAAGRSRPGRAWAGRPRRSPLGRLPVHGAPLAPALDKAGASELR